MLAFMLAATFIDPTPLALEGVSPLKARHLSGQKVTVSVRIGKPPFTWRGRTVLNHVYVENPSFSSSGSSSNLGQSRLTRSSGFVLMVSTKALQASKRALRFG